MVRKGLKHGAGDSITEDEILHGLMTGRMQLWAVHKGEEVIAGLVLQTIERECGRALFIVVMAGRDFAEWSPKVNGLLQDYADLLGAYTIEAMCREGIAKWLKALGWKRKAIKMELRHGR